MVSGMPSTVVTRLCVRVIAGLTVVVLLGGGLTACADDAASATAVVEGYLAALARGDAVAALAFGDTDQASGPLLTNAALAEALAQAPLTVGFVGQAEVTDDSTLGYPTALVNAQYALGDQNVAYTFTLTRCPSGWRMDATYASVMFAASSSLSGQEVNPWLFDIGDGSVLGVTVNGVPIEARRGFDVFPGVYHLGVTNPLVTLTGGSFTVLTVRDQVDNYATRNLDVSFALTPAAQRHLGTIAQTTLDRCLTEHTLSTSCGINNRPVGGVGQVDDPSATWSVEPAGLDLTRWQWKLYQGSVIPTGSAYEADRRMYELVLKGTRDERGFQRRYPLQSPCALIADPHNVTVVFYDSPGVRSFAQKCF